MNQWSNKKLSTNSTWSELNHVFDQSDDSAECGRCTFCQVMHILRVVVLYCTSWRPPVNQTEWAGAVTPSFVGRSCVCLMYFSLNKEYSLCSRFAHQIFNLYFIAYEALQPSNLFVLQTYIYFLILKYCMLL